MRSRFGRMAALVVAFAASMTLRPHAQTPAPGGAAPFDIVGFIDAATMTPEADGFSGGGTITVNGTTIIVPKHTLLQMPAFALTWQELFQMAPGRWKATGASGLAKADRDLEGNAPYTTYEVRIQGNRLKPTGGAEQYIAGMMFIAQQSPNTGAGYINYIDYGTGELRVGGTIGDADSGARVVINDAQGKFAPQRLDDPRFTIDEDNPTVRSETGYPMCVPKSGAADGDDNCPQSNRPKDADGNFLPTFTTDIPPGWEFMAPFDYQPNGTNALVMAPFEVGDYVTYSGHLSQDGAGGAFVLAHAVTANVGIFTQPGTQPTYVAIDVALMGVGGAPDPVLPQEATVRTRIEGFTTDPSSFVLLSAIDLDPCTGLETERFYDMVAVDPGPPGPARQGQGLGAVAGRWRWRPNTDAITLPPTRMLRATSINGAYYDWNTGEMKTPAGLAAGVYSAPNFEYIFPENLGIGNPPVPSNFQDFPFLAHGSGAYYGAVPQLDDYGMPVVLGRLGQLDPWPGAMPPTAPACPDGTNAPAVFSPIADAGPSREVTRGTVVTLDASGSRDTTTPFPATLSYTWWQVGADGQTPLNVKDTAHRIALDAGVTPFGQSTDFPRMTFTVDRFVNGQPIPDGTVLWFRVDVTNCSPWSDPGTCAASAAVTTVKVVARPRPADSLTAVVATWRVSRSRLDVNATTSDPGAELTVVGFGVMGPALPTATGVPASPGDRSYTQVGVVPPPSEITVRSNLGTVVTVPVTIRP